MIDANVAYGEPGSEQGSQRRVRIIRDGVQTAIVLKHIGDAGHFTQQLLDLPVVCIHDKGDRLSGQLGFDRFRRAVCSHLTLMEQQNAVCHIVRLLQVVRGEQDGFP